MTAKLSALEASRLHLHFPKKTQLSPESPREPVACRSWAVGLQGPISCGSRMGVAVAWATSSELPIGLGSHCAPEDPPRPGPGWRHIRGAFCTTLWGGRRVRATSSASGRCWVPRTYVQRPGRCIRVWTQTSARVGQLCLYQRVSWVRSRGSLLHDPGPWNSFLAFDISLFSQGRVVVAQGNGQALEIATRIWVWARF